MPLRLVRGKFEQLVVSEGQRRGCGIDMARCWLEELVVVDDECKRITGGRDVKRCELNTLKSLNRKGGNVNEIREGIQRLKEEITHLEHILQQRKTVRGESLLHIGNILTPLPEQLQQYCSSLPISLPKPNPNYLKGHIVLHNQRLKGDILHHFHSLHYSLYTIPSFIKPSFPTPTSNHTKISSHKKILQSVPVYSILPIMKHNKLLQVPCNILAHGICFSTPPLMQQEIIDCIIIDHAKNSDNNMEILIKTFMKLLFHLSPICVQPKNTFLEREATNQINIYTNTTTKVYILNCTDFYNTFLPKTDHQSLEITIARCFI